MKIASNNTCLIVFQSYMVGLCYGLTLKCLPQSSASDPWSHDGGPYLEGSGSGPSCRK